MPKPKSKSVSHQPGPGRSTQKDAFADVAKQIAERNEKASVAARKLRADREQEAAARKRRLDLS